MTVGKKSDSEVNSNIIILSKAASVKKKTAVKLCHVSKTFVVEMIEDWMLISFHSLHIIYQIVYQDVSRVLTLSLDFQMCLCCLSLNFIENDLSLYTLLFLKWITNKNLLCSTWNSAQCYAPAWMGRDLGENGQRDMYGWVPSLFIWNCHNIANRVYPSTKCFGVTK